jgi:hypothetical protein
LDFSWFELLVMMIAGGLEVMSPLRREATAHGGRSFHGAGFLIGNDWSDRSGRRRICAAAGNTSRVVPDFDPQSATCA